MNIKQIFGGRVSSAADVETHDFPPRETQNRFVAVIVGSGSAVVSGELYDSVSELAEMNSLWSVESIAPIPFISASSERIAQDDITTLVQWLTHRSLRSVAVISSVSYGTIGRGTRFAFGSVCLETVSLLEAVFCLDNDTSWGSKHVALMLGHDVNSLSPEHVRGVDFFKL